MLEQGRAGGVRLHPGRGGGPPLLRGDAVAAAVEDTPYGCVFQAPNAVLRVTVVSDLVVAPYTVIGWAVTNIEASAHELVARGVEPVRYEQLTQDELGVWRSPSGARVIWFHDPDGNVLSLTQR